MSRTALFLFVCFLAVAAAFQAGVPLRSARPLCVALCASALPHAPRPPAMLLAAIRQRSLTAVACAHPSAFRAAPLAKPGMMRATAPDMMLEAPATQGVAAASQLIASSAGDFGGYTIPVIGLTLLAAIIGILAGPVED